MAISRGFRWAAVGLGLVMPVQLAGQSRAIPTVPDSVERSDPADLLVRARDAQARYEWERLRLMPPSSGGSGGACDEYVGRVCFWYDAEGWRPKPEPPEVGRKRELLIHRLDSIAALVPGDAWLLGQRVWYRAEAGRWLDAFAAARGCGRVEPWWCSALEGFTLHGLGRYREARAAFARALSLMGPVRAARWRIPRHALDDEAGELLDHAPPDSLGPRLRRMWMLADPLYLVPGNDRETAHYARWTVARIREDAHNPFGLTWGSDLEELLIRNGWEVAWAREHVATPGLGRDAASGYNPPQQRRYLPSGSVLSSPSLAAAEDLRADEGPARSLYAPAYAPVLLPTEPQVAVFPRGDRFVVVATSYLPADTSSGDHGPRPPALLDPGVLTTEGDQAGLFLVHTDDGETRSRTRGGGTTGRFLLEAPAGRYIVSVESWSPTRRRAGRYRIGLVRRGLPEDVATLSDLLMLDTEGSEPHTLSSALPHALVSPVIRSGQRVALGWEVSGLGWGSEDVTYRLRVERTDVGLLGRVGRWLRLGGREQALSLSWTEPGPAQPKPQFHWLALDLPTLKPGRYEVRLEAKMSARSALVSRRTFEVVEDGTAAVTEEGRNR